MFRIHESREHFCSRNSWKCSRNEFFTSAHETGFTKRVFCLCSRNECSRNECSRNEFFGTAHETSAHETSAHETSFWPVLTKRVSRNEFFICAHETSAHETSAHETSFWALLTKRVLTKRVLTKRIQTRERRTLIYYVMLSRGASLQANFLLRASLRLDKNPTDWVTYNNGYLGHRLHPAKICIGNTSK